MLDQTGTHQKEYDAVMELARTLFRYGQFERVLSLLELAAWLSPGAREVGEQRVATLIKLSRWEDALQEILSNVGIDKVDYKLLCQVYWKLGEINLGDRHFAQRSARAGT